VEEIAVCRSTVCVEIFSEFMEGRCRAQHPRIFTQLRVVFLGHFQFLEMFGKRGTPLFIPRRYIYVYLPRGREYLSSGEKGAHYCFGAKGVSLHRRERSTSS
jgi:hypothetical protein